MEFTGLRTNNPLLSGFEQDIEKAHVKSYTKTIKSGKMVQVNEHDDKRTKKEVKKKEEKPDLEASHELYLFIDNHSDLYRQRMVPIINNLKKKQKKGIYDSDKAAKLFQYLVDDGAKRYKREVPDAEYTFTPATRKHVAKEFRDNFEENKD